MTVEIYRDAWGVPHLRAGDARELARAQGLATAHDRAWQVEVERHRARGTSAAFLGPDALGWDRFARQARLDDTARRCFTALERRDPETAAWVRAYVDGVNQGLPEGARRAPEFTAVALAPGRWEPWTPLGVWLATHVLFAGFPGKLWREEVVRHLGPDAVGLFATDGPGTSGSNGWLVTGERTATGGPVVAGDPHRYIEAPGVYQQIRLSCPEFDVIGLAVPGVPGIAHFGHTGTVAWAITNAMADYQDLYRERLRRTGDGGFVGDGVGAGGRVEALGPDGVWYPASRHTEIIEVADGDPVEVEVIETDRGPVVINGDVINGGTEPYGDGGGDTDSGSGDNADGGSGRDPGGDVSTAPSASATRPASPRTSASPPSSPSSAPAGSPTWTGRSTTGPNPSTSSRPPTPRAVCCTGWRAGSRSGARTTARGSSTPGSPGTSGAAGTPPCPAARSTRASR